jgi:hypothetical protein
LRKKLAFIVLLVERGGVGGHLDRGAEPPIRGYTYMEIRLQEEDGRFTP